MSKMSRIDALALAVLIGSACATAWIIHLSAISKVVVQAAPLLRRDAVPTDLVPMQGFQQEGNQQANIVLLEFADFQCPFCKRFAEDVLPEIRKEFVQPGTVRLAFGHLPLDIHPVALSAAEAAECSGTQGKFWQMHDLMFDSPLELTSDRWNAYAAQIGLNQHGFSACLEHHERRDAINDNVAIATRLGISGTPTLLIGVMQQAQMLRVVDEHTGLPDALVLAADLNRAIQASAAR